MTESLELSFGAAKLTVGINPTPGLDGHVTLYLKEGCFTLLQIMSRENALQMAAMLANAAGVDDPVPVGEATISDWSVLEDAQ